jgi:hypothetical protein
MEQNRRGNNMSKQKHKTNTDELEAPKRDLGLRDYQWDTSSSARWNLAELKRHLKRAWDRVWTGIDRHAYWSYDYYLIDQMAEVISWFKEHRAGSPIVDCPFYKYENNEEVLCYNKPLPECSDCKETNHTLWTQRLDEIHQKLEKYKLLRVSEFENAKELTKLQNQIFDWFRRYLCALWD